MSFSLTALRGGVRWETPTARKLVVKGTAGELKFERLL
jgi:hypothetical protein